MQSATPRQCQVKSFQHVILNRNHSVSPSSTISPSNMTHSLERTVPLLPAHIDRQPSTVPPISMDNAAGNLHSTHTAPTSEIPLTYLQYCSIAAHCAAILLVALAIVNQKRRFLYKVRETEVRQLLPQLREAVSALTVAQQNAEKRVRIHPFVEHDSHLTDDDRIGHL